MPGTLASVAAAGEQVLITHRQQRWELVAGQVFTFGRAETCTLCVDPADLGISRLAGSIEHDAGVWWILNRSGARTVTAVDELGIRTLIAPGRRLAVTGPTTVVIEGSARRHALEVVAESAPAFGAPVAQPVDARPTSTAHDVVINDADRLALVALFSGYLEQFPRYDPHPRSYADAAATLGWPRTTLVKRIEYLRSRLTGAGVPNLLGETALASLAEWALTSRVLTREDLTLLRPEHPDRASS